MAQLFHPDALSWVRFPPSQALPRLGQGLMARRPLLSSEAADDISLLMGAARAAYPDTSVLHQDLLRLVALWHPRPSVRRTTLACALRRLSDAVTNEIVAFAVSKGVILRGRSAAEDQAAADAVVQRQELLAEGEVLLGSELVAQLNL